MQLTVTGKQVEVGNALRRYVESALEALLGKYFGSAIEAHAVFALEAHLIRAEISLHIGRGIVINSTDTRVWRMMCEVVEPRISSRMRV